MLCRLFVRCNRILGSFSQHASSRLILPTSFKSKVYIHTYTSSMAARNSDEGVDEFQNLMSLFQQIGEHTSENADYFFLKNKSNTHSDFNTSFQTILNVLDPLQISLEVITNCCAKFDLSPNCKGNGYRSIVNIVESCLTKILHINKQIQKNRDKLFFRSYHVYMELESYTQVLSRLLTVVHLAIVLVDCSDVGNLFPHAESTDEVMSDFEKINRECFYGRSFGFQYADSIQQSLQVVAVTMAAYGDGFNRHNHPFARALSSMLHSGKYMVDPELRAKRITELTQNANIDFCKAFWSLTEEYGVQHAPLLICPAMAVNMEFIIPPDSVTVTSFDGKEIEIDMPLLHAEQKGINARLLSYVWREGQDHDENGKSNKAYSSLGPKPAAKSRYLMLHCHGGGFVAQSSKSHEMYLRYWAKELKIPILSIDYSLSPNAPYPQALNEVYFAYVWVLNNLNKLGTTGEKICFTGDSAGANLVTCITLKAIEDNIRLPDSIVVAYPPYRLQYLPSPSRILCLMDPLLPVGVLKTCIQAYSGSINANQNNAGLKRLKNSVCYSGENYNPFDLDLRDRNWLPYNQFKLDHTYSFSESNLGLVKSQFESKYGLHEQDTIDDASFYSDFPYSDAESSTLDEIDSKDDDFISFNDKASTKSEQPNSYAPSLISSLTTQVSSKVQSFTAGMSAYVYGTSFNNESNKNKITIQRTDQILVEDNKIEDTKDKTETIVTSSTECVNNDILDSSAQTKDCNLTHQARRLDRTFSICKVCLHNSSHCLCGLDSHERHANHRKVQENYRSSYHHINNVYHSRKMRTSSLSHDQTDYDTSERLRSKSTSFIVENKFESKDSRASGLNSSEDLKLILHHYKTEKTANSPKDFPSPKVLYDKSTDSCVILTPQEESKYEEHEEKFENCTLIEDGRDPLMSPYLAKDDILRKLPPITIVACSLDPLFDDSVEFVRKLQKLDNKAELYVLDKLPHGFLNFQAFSGVAREGCDLLIACIKKSLDMGMRRNDSSMGFGFKFKK